MRCEVRKLLRACRTLTNRINGFLFAGSRRQMTEIDIRTKVAMSLHLGSGQANVNLDAEIVHDEFGLPYFLAKRFKGLPYKSAVEFLFPTQGRMSILPFEFLIDLKIFRRHIFRAAIFRQLFNFFARHNVRKLRCTRN